MTEFINFYLVPGLVLGSIYALGAIGLSLIFGVLRFAHFAHGELMTLGAYGALTVKNVTGWPILVVLPISMALTAFVGVAIDRVFYRPVPRGPDHYPRDRLLRNGADGALAGAVVLGRENLLLFAGPNR